MKELIAAIVAFFASLFAAPAQIAPSPSPTPIITPLPTPGYPRTTYVNNALNYQLLYPTDTDITESPDFTTAWDERYTLRIDQYSGNSLDMETILDTDLMCAADGPTGSVSCHNTAIKPFTNQSGTAGFLIRRTKTITGLPNPGEYKDTAYVFPVKTGAVIVSVEYPLEKNLQILTDTANWFTALP